MEFEGTDNAVPESPVAEEQPTSLDTAPAPEAEGGEPEGSDEQAPQLDDDGNPIPPDEEAEQTDFEWDGESYKLPKKLAESLRDGALMRADYTRKAQEVAETGRRTAAEQQRLAHQAQAMQAGIEGIKAVANAERVLGQLEQNLERALQEGDPIGATAAQHAIGKWRAHLSDTHQWLDNVQQATVSLSEQHTKQQWEETSARLSKEIKGWETGEPNRNISAWALKNGFTPAQISAITHHAPIKALYKAYLYDQLQAAKKPAAPQKQALEPTRQIARGQTAPASRGSYYDLVKKNDPTDAISLRRSQRVKEKAR